MRKSLSLALLLMVGLSMGSMVSCKAPTTGQGDMIACPDIYQPVCGADGRTYSNACRAAQAGQHQVEQGECPTISPIIGR